MQIMAYCGSNGPIILAEQTGSQAPIPAPLIIAPGTYGYNTPRYIMTAEGLYRFMSASGSYADCGHRIVYQSDVHSLLTGLAGVTIHGTTDESLSNADKTNRARTGWIKMRCGHIDTWARSILSGLGISSRSVSVLTMETSNGYDDGHVATEVLVNGAWRLYDLTFNRAFRDGSDLPIQAKNIAANVAAGTYTDDVLVPVQPQFDTRWYDANAFYMSIALEAIAGLPNWTRRTFQAVGIWHTDGLCYFKIPPGSENRKSWLLSLSASYRVIDSPAQWDAMFYPGA